MLLAPGALTTRMPRALAASTSTLSTPVPARAMMRRLGAASSSAAVDLRRAADDERVGVGEVARPGRRASGPSARRRSSPARRAAGPARRRADRRRRRFSMGSCLRSDAPHVVDDVPELVRGQFAAVRPHPGRFHAVADDREDLAVAWSRASSRVGRGWTAWDSARRPSCRRLCPSRHDIRRIAFDTAPGRRRSTSRRPALRSSSFAACG